MPRIYLSPSTQEFNQYVTPDFNEEQTMNMLADLLEPYLYSSGIEFVRNEPTMTAGSSIRQSNAGNFDFHLALHTNASPENLAGQLQGVQAFYFPYSDSGKRMADIMVKNFKRIYPNADLVLPKPTTSLGEVDRTRAPAVLMEIGYHDNPEDVAWLLDNLPLIARTLAQSLTQYFGLPFVEPTVIYKGRVDTQSTGLNLRSRPSTQGAIVGSIPRGAYIDVYGETGDGWLSVRYGNLGGFVRSEYVQILE